MGQKSIKRPHEPREGAEMGSQRYTRITCDTATCEAAYGPEEGGTSAVQQMAQHQLGWGRGRLPNGVSAFLCPNCLDGWIEAEGQRRTLEMLAIRQIRTGRR